MTIRAVADTHAVIWYVFADNRISLAARTIMQDAARADDQIGMSSMTLVETVYLLEKGRIDAHTLDRILEVLDHPQSLFVEIPVDRRISASMQLVDRQQVPDLPDRIIAATAVQLGVPLISRDGKIRSSSVTTIW